MTQRIQNIRRAHTSASMAAALSVVGKRWALRIIWELRAGPLNFRSLQAACGGISPSVLQARLHEWRNVEVIEMIPDLGYRLSRSGERLFQVLAQLEKWSAELHVHDSGKLN